MNELGQIWYDRFIQRAVHNIPLRASLFTAYLIGSYDVITEILTDYANVIQKEVDKRPWLQGKNGLD